MTTMTESKPIRSLTDSNAALRRVAETPERDSKLIQALIDAAGSSIVILDEQRTIVFANRAWRQFAALGGSQAGDHGLGKKYPEVFKGNAAASCEDARAMTAGLERVIASEESEFQMKYRCTAFAPPLWFLMRTSQFRIPGPDGSRLIMVSHDDVSEAEFMSSDLRPDEQSLARLLKTSNIVPWEAPIGHNQFTYVGEQAVDILGYTREQWKDEGFWLRHLHPADRARVVGEYSRLSTSSEHFKCEYRMIAKGGRVVWVEDIVDVVRPFGKPPMMHGFTMDITERKETERALAELSGRLITAQEEERKRIARELHDDLNQRIALISIELAQLSENGAGDSNEVRTRLSQIQRKVVEISTTIHRMSYELHPSKLDHLGLAAAINSFCSELAQSRGITIHFEPETVPRVISRDAMLCVFRVVQEALQNAAKYSGADEIHVTLTGSDSLVECCVNDDGEGFVTTSDKMTKGLGITSMQERVRLVRGEFSITSAPGRGTRVKVTVPTRPNAKAEPAGQGRQFLSSITNAIGVPPNETYTYNSR